MMNNASQLALFSIPTNISTSVSYGYEHSKKPIIDGIYLTLGGQLTLFPKYELEQFTEAIKQTLGQEDDTFYITVDPREFLGDTLIKYNINNMPYITHKNVSSTLPSEKGERDTYDNRLRDH